MTGDIRLAGYKRLACDKPTITTRFASVVVGSPEGLGFAPSHLWLCPKNPVGGFQSPTPLTKE